nr:uncharacterized protein LOC109762057 [Aegilops tauschii subsp. strangulata]
MLTAFIGEEKWKFEKARQLKKAQCRKEHSLKKNVVNMTTDELIAIQTEIKGLSDEFNVYRTDWLGAKVRFFKLVEGFTTSVAAPTQHESPQAEAFAQSTEEHACTADENQAADETASTRADGSIPAANEIARATTSVASEEQSRPAEPSTAEPEETEPTRPTTSVVPESRVDTEVQMGSDEPHTTPSIPEEIPATSADENADEEKKTQAATEAEIEIPQPVVPENVIPEPLMTLTDTPQPK